MGKIVDTVDAPVYGEMGAACAAVHSTLRKPNRSEGILCTDTPLASCFLRFEPDSQDTIPPYRNPLSHLNGKAPGCRCRHSVVPRLNAAFSASGVSKLSSSQFQKTHRRFGPRLWQRRKRTRRLFGPHIRFIDFGVKLGGKKLTVLV